MDRDSSRTALVRLFPGWAQSPVWLPGGPVDLRDSLLTRELIQDLIAWAGHREASVLAGSGGTPQDQQYLSQGRQLAERLAAELGRSFTIVFESGTDGEHPAHSLEPATNPAAERAFTQQLAAGHGNPDPADGPFYAWAPLSGDTFGPFGPGGPVRHKKGRPL